MSHESGTWEHRTLQLAGSLGAEECQVKTVREVRRTLSVKAGEWQSLDREEILEQTVIVHRDGRRARVEAAGTVEPEGLVTRVLEMARFTPQDEHLCLADPDPCVTLEGTFDPGIAGLDGAAMAGVLEELIEAGRHPHLAEKEARLSTSVKTERILNSRGIDRSQSSTLIKCSLSAMGRHGGKLTDVDAAFRLALGLKGFRHTMLGEVQELTRRILSGFDPVKSPAGRHHLVLSPSMVNRLLVSVPEYHAHGRAIADGFSRFADRLGQTVASPHFSLEDAVHDTSLAGATAFDEEGSATRPLLVVSQGVLVSHLDSCRSAHRRGTQPTGHPWELHAPVVSGGVHEPAELGALAGEYLLALDFSGHVDYISGDFSGVLKNSRWCNPARGIDVPLIETMISGNVFELLHRIVALGRQENLYGCYRMPWMLVEGVEVSAG